MGLGQGLAGNGGLPSSIVSASSLPWQAGYPYTQGQLVIVNGALYEAASSFTSGASFAADGTNWTPLTGPGQQFTHVTPASSYAPDASIPFHWITLTANITLSAMTNVKVSSVVTLYFVQDATGGRVVTLDASYNNQPPRVSPAPWAPTSVTFINLGTAVTPIWTIIGGGAGVQQIAFGSASLPLNTGWSASTAPPATAYIDLANRVWLSGSLTRTAGAVATATTFPLGWYPKTGTVYVPVMQAGGTAGGFLGITNAGLLTFTPTSGALSFYLDSVSWPAGV